MAANTDEDFDLTLKFLLLGEDYVGKTCILKRYVDDMFGATLSTSKVPANISLHV